MGWLYVLISIFLSSCLMNRKSTKTELSFKWGSPPNFIYSCKTLFSTSLLLLTNMKYYFALILFVNLPFLINGQLSFSPEFGINNYDFIEINPEGFFLNTENKLQDRYFGLQIEQQLNSKFSVNVNAYYTFVSHNVESNSPVSNPISIFKYDIIDVIPLLSYSPQKNIEVGIGSVIQNLINKQHIALNDEVENKPGARNIGYTLVAELYYRKLSLILSYKQLINFPDDSIFQYSKFYGIRAGMSYRLVEIFSDK